MTEDLVCPKSNYQILPFETYALLFTASLVAKIVSVHNAYYVHVVASYVCVVTVGSKVCTYP